MSLPCSEGQKHIFAYDPPPNPSSPPYFEITKEVINSILIVALLKHYENDLEMSLDQIQKEFKPLFDSINENYLIEDDDPRRPTAKQVQELNGGNLYYIYKNIPEHVKEKLFP